ncbi:MAG: CocE/NonD family hydrolase [Gemmatimonadetes bacterium]|nr:CocE/NonD family hydrolase [Gemmatimonadota bacterium]
MRVARLIALAAALPAAAETQEAAGHGYRNLSQPTHQTMVEYEVRVPMRDGVRLAANIVRPATPGRHPVVINYIPYGKDPDRWFAERGYVTIFAEGRGTGRSEGVMADYFDAQSFRDGYDLVEWAAAQPWSTGKVGMWGISFGAINSTRVAALRPPHLAAIAVNSSYANFFGDHWYPGGVRTNHPYVWHGVGNVLYTMLRGPVYDDGEGGKTLDVDTWKRHIADNGWEPFFPPQWAHARYDDYWREKDLRSKYEHFAVPTLQTANYFDHARNLDEAFQNYLVLRKHKVPQRLFVGPWTHGGFGPGQPLDFQLLRLAWFDRFLKGVATGIDEEPPVTLFIMRENRWRHEADWPIARSVLTPFYPAPDRSLRRTPGESARPAEFSYAPWVGSAAGPYGTWFDAQYDEYLTQPDQRVDEAESLTFTSEPLAADLEVTGMPEIVFFASSTADDTDFSIKLSDVLPNGKSEWVTRGWLNSSYRESDVNPRRPEDWRFVEPTPIRPGAIHRYRVTLQNVSYLFRRGHRIRLTIASSDWPSNWPNPKPADNTIHFRHGRERTTVLLPVVPRPARPLAAPRLPLMPVPQSTRDPDSRIWIEHDLTAGLVSYRSRDSAERTVAGATVSGRTEWRIDLTKTAPYRQTIDYASTVTVNRPGQPPVRFVYRVKTDSAGPRASVELREGAVP